MGILNLTPDSFSDGGQFASPAEALSKADGLLAEGAATIDIGGESTAPRATPITAAEELWRIEEVVKALAPRAFVSVDTYKSAVARRCLEHGARMINDTSALRADPEMAAVVRDFDAYVVLMHSKNDGPLPHATLVPKLYHDLVSQIAEFLKSRIDVALDAGIAMERIIIDPGMGAFISTDPEDSWKVLANLDRLRDCGVTAPILIGTSRKGFLGGALEERDPLSQLSALGAVLKGASIIRTHNVAMARSFLHSWIKMFEAGK